MWYKFIVEVITNNGNKTRSVKGFSGYKDLDRALEYKKEFIKFLKESLVNESPSENGRVLIIDLEDQTSLYQQAHVYPISKVESVSMYIEKVC